MNRFRTKKKVKDDFSAPRPSQESDSSSGFRFRKGKKVQEEPKQEIDISAALPPSDDFRTSLLMTGLSARFSMLREQDDPNTKIGKASDDSVLFPQRQSRLDFGVLRGLSDIAEVESIKAVPPFARMDSFHSDDAESTHGSVMSRAKPTEGNNLFGGRQKIYKISVGAESSRAVGGMGGRALYDDDVALSAFQKWKKAEKERQLSDDDNEEASRRPSAEEPRPQSPFSNSYNRKRETSSTTSSMPSMARNSTAATSITSQHPTPSLKDFQASSTSSTSANSTPSLERNFTRTRRLYETGLNHDLHEQQASALTRIDTLTRQRTLGSRTPDLGQHSPSPTTMGFAERFAERRIMAKSSAPNLRSMSPSTTGSSAGTPDLGIRVPSGGERTNFGGAPPLSPPISETEEVANLSIQPSDRGKATALGVFHKPSQPYDETRYAQRQLQLQQGRETPTHRFRTESNASIATGRSRSTSSAQRQPIELKMDMPKTQPALEEEARPPTFFDDSDSVPIIPAHSVASLSTSQLVIPRPSDSDHPAFRDASALPTPLSMVSGEPSPTGSLSKPPTPNEARLPTDSPTLGPTLAPTSGLSGLVRQHLRNDSNGSSIYGGGPLTSGLESRFPSDIPLDPEETGTLQDIAAKLKPWDGHESGQDWSLSYCGTEVSPDKRATSSTMPEPEKDSKVPTTSATEVQEETDEFASQLAESRRRIREKLTSYVESDSGRSPSPLPLGESRDGLNTQASPRSNTLGLLRSKTSRGSLIERNRELGSKSMRVLGINSSGTGQPLAYRYAVEEPPSLARMKEEMGRRPQTDVVGNEYQAHGDEEQHAGVRAFKQARRELQKMREVDTEQRHHQSPYPPQASLPDALLPRTSPRKDGAVRQRTPSGADRRPPPVFHSQQRDRSVDSHPSSRSASLGPMRDDGRDRSDSNSSGDRSGSRPPMMRARNGSSPPADLLGGAMLRSPGLPGTNIRRSPHMPPQGYPVSPARLNQASYGSNQTLHVQHGRGYDNGQLSPISPLSPFMHSAPPTPGALPSPQRPPAVPTPGNINSDGTEVPGLSDAMKRTVKKKDISEPTFVMSTSRVPTVPLPPEAAANRSRSSSRSRSNSNAQSHPPPPLPPINPRRRRESSRSRGVFGLGAHRDEDMSSASTPNLLSMADPVDESRSTFSISDDEDPKPNRRRLRKMPTDTDMATRMRAVSNAPAYNVGPPASRMVVTQAPRRPMPGGMI